MGKLEIGFVNVTHGGGGPFGEDGSGPVAIGTAEIAGTKGVQVNGHGSLAELEVLVEQGAIFVPGVPPVIQGRVIHGVVGSEGLFVAVNDGGNTGAVVELGDALKPLVARGVAAALFGYIQIAHSP